MKIPPLNKYPPVKQVGDQERVGMVKEIFATVTDRYDFLNRFLSLRRDVYWRKFAVRKMVFFRTHRFLDIACGTGDLSILACLRHKSIRAVGVDFVHPMLKKALLKKEKNRLGQTLNFIQGNALMLPFGENMFDVTAMAFGIRNIPQKTEAIKEMLRVTVPGGQIMILEMNFIQNRFFKCFYRVYLNHLLPLLAGVFSKNAAAYYYLADSIMNFPAPSEFAAFLKETGIDNVQIYPLTLGMTCLFVGKKSTHPLG
ncbi:MAG TPA: ubiquinone/menaquinone biosynthesis methyltransferase [Smithella sp.]|nr:ubiquinone/menaquinone biosynthesis methyltransferase [Smithella sp.]